MNRTNPWRATIVAVKEVVDSRDQIADAPQRATADGLPSDMLNQISTWLRR
jgi:hypothetical protein